MKNKIVLFFALTLIGAGLLLGFGIRTHQEIIEKPLPLNLTETSS